MGTMRAAVLARGDLAGPLGGGGTEEALLAAKRHLFVDDPKGWGSKGLNNKVLPPISGFSGKPFPQTARGLR